MKKLLLFAVLISAFHHLYAQKTIRIKRQTPYYKIIEKLDVLKSDTSVRQGHYKLISDFWKRILTEGFYFNNQKDSIWIDYGYKGNIVAKGHYTRDKKSGIWEYFDNKGELTDKYDYDRQLMVLHKPDKHDTVTYKVLKGTDTILTKLERPPLFLGGRELMDRPGIFDLRYPADARDMNKQGKVIISFIVNIDGTVTDFKVDQAVFPSIDKTALKAAKLIPGNWLPGLLHGVPVAVVYKVPFDFTLSSN